MINIVLTVLLILFLVYGFVISRGITTSEYFSFRGQADFRTILFSLLSSLIGGWMFFGLSAVGYEAGVVGYIIGIAYGIGLIIVGYYSPSIKKYMDKNQNDTLDDFIGDYHGEKTQFTVTSLNFLFFISVLAAQFIALSSFLEIFSDYESNYIYYLAAIIVIVYTAISGFKGVLFTDKIQFWVIAVCVFIMSLIVYPSLEIENISSLPDNYFNGLGYGSSFLIGIFLFLPLSMLARSDLWQRIASAEDAKEVKKAFYYSAPIIFIFYILLTNFGLIARSFNIDASTPEGSGLELFVNLSTQTDILIPTFLILIVSIGILCALISTIDTNLNILSVAITKLIYRLKGRNYEDKGIIKFAGVIAIILGTMGVIASELIPDIVDLLVSAASIIMVFLPAIIGALYYKESLPVIATSSILLGFASFIALTVLLSDPKTAMLPGVLVSFLIYFSLRKIKVFRR